MVYTKIEEKLKNVVAKDVITITFKDNNALMVLFLLDMHLLGRIIFREINLCPSQKTDILLKKWSEDQLKMFHLIVTDKFNKKDLIDRAFMIEWISVDKIESD